MCSEITTIFIHVGEQRTYWSNFTKRKSYSWGTSCNSGKGTCTCVAYFYALRHSCTRNTGKLTVYVSAVLDDWGTQFLWTGSSGAAMLVVMNEACKIACTSSLLTCLLFAICLSIHNLQSKVIQATLLYPLNHLYSLFSVSYFSTN